MLTLAINTSGSQATVAIFNSKKVLGEKTWLSTNDESEKLLPAVTQTLRSARLKLTDLGRVVVVSGPGPFSAVRIGVTVASVLASSLNIPIYSVDSPTLWKARLSEKTVILLYAGGKYVACIEGKRTCLLSIDALIEHLKRSKNNKVYSEIPQAQKHLLQEKIEEIQWTLDKELKGFGEVMRSLSSKLLNYSADGVITPEYWKPPHITESKKG